MTLFTAEPASSNVDPDEKQLVEGLSIRDPEQVRVFLDRAHGPVYGMACRLSKDPDIRQDWTHDVLLKILDELSRGNFVYRWPGCFWSWFTQRSRFILLNLYRKQKVQDERAVSGEQADAVFERAAMPDSTDPQRVMENIAIRDALEGCLDRLQSHEHRRAFSLLLLEELSYEEIAGAMGSPVNTIRSWIHRARSVVRRCMAQKLAIGDAVMGESS